MVCAQYRQIRRAVTWSYGHWVKHGLSSHCFCKMSESCLVSALSKLIDWEMCLGVGTCQAVLPEPVGWSIRTGGVCGLCIPHLGLEGVSWSCSLRTLQMGWQAVRWYGTVSGHFQWPPSLLVCFSLQLLGPLLQSALLGLPLDEIGL